MKELITKALLILLSHGDVEVLGEISLALNGVLNSGLTNAEKNRLLSLTKRAIEGVQGTIAGEGPHTLFDVNTYSKCKSCLSRVYLTDFPSEISIREFEISGLCAGCQKSRV